MKLITAYLCIGKSKALVTYTFKAEDFIRIENEKLILKNEERVLKLPEEQIRAIIVQLEFS